MQSDLLTIASYDNPHEADLAKLRLESEGLYVFLDNRNAVEAYWAIAGLIGGIKLKVPAGQKDRAIALLGEIDRARRDRAASGEAAAPFETLHCLKCGEAMREEQDTCPKCGWSYAEG